MHAGTTRLDSMQWFIPLAASCGLGLLLSSAAPACNLECLDITISGDCFYTGVTYWKVTDMRGCKRNWYGNPGGNGLIQGGVAAHRDIVKYQTATTCTPTGLTYGRGACGTIDGFTTTIQCYPYCMTDY